MGHHIDKDGNFQSDKYPDLPPNKITLSFKDHAAQCALAEYIKHSDDKELAEDIRSVLSAKFSWKYLPPIDIQD